MTSDEVMINVEGCWCKAMSTNDDRKAEQQSGAKSWNKIDEMIARDEFQPPGTDFSDKILSNKGFSLLLRSSKMKKRPHSESQSPTAPFQVTEFPGSYCA
jgi:hypothetical protein